MGGDWHDLGGSLSAGSEDSVSLQPLARIDDAAERAWAAEWVAAILAKEGVAIDPTAKEHIWSALNSLASSPVQERTITGLAVLLAIDGTEAGAAPLLRRRSLRPAARRRGRASRISIGPSLRDRGTDRRRRGARRPHLPVPPHRRPARWPPDAAHHRRRMARPRRSRLRAAAPRMAEDARKKNASVVFATQFALRHRWQQHRAGDRRELPDARFPPERTRDRTADHRHLSPLRLERPADRDHRAGDPPSAITTASRGAAIACLSWGSALSRSLSAPLPPRPIMPRSSACSPSMASTASRPPGSPTATSPGRRISFPILPIWRHPYDQATSSGGGERRRSLARGRRAAGLRAVDRLRPDQLLAERPHRRS